MTTQLTRRGILKALGIGTLALAAEPILEPARKLWFVSSNAPVGSRIEQPVWEPPFVIEEEVGSEAIDRYIARTWSLKLQITEEDLYDPREDEIKNAAQRLMKSMYATQLRDMEPAIKEALSKGHWYHA